MMTAIGLSSDVKGRCQSALESQSQKVRTAVLDSRGLELKLSDVSCSVEYTRVQDYDSELKTRYIKIRTDIVVSMNIEQK